MDDIERLYNILCKEGIDVHAILLSNVFSLSQFSCFGDSENVGDSGFCHILIVFGANMNKKKIKRSKRSEMGETVVISEEAIHLKNIT